MPNHIIFGARVPRIEITIEGTREYMYSMNNYNLYREECDLDDKGTFTIGCLFKVARNCPFCLRWTNITVPVCETTCEPCSILAEKYEELRARDGSIPSNGSRLRRIHLHKEPHLYECEVLSALLGCTTTPAERKFAESYYRLAISWMDFPEDVTFCFGDLRKTYGDFLWSWHENLNRLSPQAKEPKEVIRAIIESLAAPALIPKVWFNCTYAPSQQAESETKGPNCVDFLFIFENKVHVVEIDGPSHYARPDSGGKWIADEETYTANLKLQRYLCVRGYEVHRLTEWEVLNATESELIDLLSDVLGMAPRHFKPRLLTPH